MNEKFTTEETIDLVHLFNVLKKNAIFIILASLIGLGVGIGFDVYKAKNHVPMYQAWGTMLVNRQDYISSDTAITTAETAKQVVQTYSIIIKSDRVLDVVIENLALDMEYTELAQNIHITNINDTQIMQISYVSTSATFSQAVVEEIFAVAPNIIVDVIGGGSAKTVTTPKVPNAPIPRTATYYSALGFVVALIAICAIVILKSLFDTRIKSEKDVDILFDAPVIGVLPLIEACQSTKKHSGYQEHNS